MEKVLKDIQMEIHILDSSSMAKLMERVFIPGKIEKFMMGNGIRD